MQLVERSVVPAPPPTRRRALPLTIAVPGAALAGLLLMLAFPPYGVWPAAVVSVAVVTVLLHGRGARAGALVGLAAGLGFFVPLLHWTGVYVGPVPWLLLAVTEAAYLAGMGALAAPATRLRGWPLWVAALWVAQEALRGRWPFGGFPWGRLAFSQADAPTVSLAALGGAPLVTFAVALAGTLLAMAGLAAVRRARRTAAAALAGSLVTVAAGLAVPAATPSGATVDVAVVQGNVPTMGLDFNAQREAVLRNHVEATHELARRVAAGEVPAPDLVIWPENSSDIDPFTDASAHALIDGAVAAIGVPVLVGAVVVAPDGEHLENTGIVWDPVTGPGETYVKRHPVPFGEYIPMRDLARLVSEKVDLVRRDFVGGDEPGVLQVGPVTVGDVICFEVGYDDIVGDVVRGGAEVIAVQTNNATFGFTPQSEQQLAMSRVRAVEHGRSVLVAATSGISAIIAPDGSVVERADIFTREVLTAPVTLAAAPGIAARVGAAPEAALAMVGVLAAALALGRGRPRRHEDTRSWGREDDEL